VDPSIPAYRADTERCDDRQMGDVVDLLSRPVYGLAQVDRILGHATY
jgi:hypothetical protein